MGHPSRPAEVVSSKHIPFDVSASQSLMPMVTVTVAQCSCKQVITYIVVAFSIRVQGLTIGLLTPL